MSDLEQLLRKRQDQLRGRPEDWIDRFGDWRKRQNWVGVMILAAVLVLVLLGVR
jgi:hypothetical protein